MTRSPTTLKTTTDHVPFAQERWRGYVDPAWRDFFTDADPIRKVMAVEHRVVRSRPNCRVVFANTSLGDIYLKHMTAAKDHPSIVARIKWAIQRSQALTTCRVTREMNRKAITAPPVVLAVRRRVKFKTEELLISLAVPGQTLKTALRAHPTTEQTRALVTLAARRVAALHRAGFIHGDLLAGNMIVTPDRQDVAFVDNDRTRHARFSVNRSKRRNLVQITQRIRRHGLWVTRAFLDVYCGELGVDAKGLALLERFVLPRASRRWRTYRRSKQTRSSDANA